MDGVLIGLGDAFPSCYDDIEYNEQREQTGCLWKHGDLG